jgi:hypothetical protein
MGNKPSTVSDRHDSRGSDVRKQESLPSISSGRREALGWAPARSRMAKEEGISGPAGRLRNLKPNAPTTHNPMFGGPNDRPQRVEETPFTRAVPFATSKEVQHERDRRALSTSCFPMHSLSQSINYEIDASTY